MSSTPALRPSKARLFVALDLPEGARADLARWRASALGDPGLRLVAPEALHVTLVFLGHLAEDQIPRIAATLPADATAPVMRALSVKPVPPRRPRLFALDLSDQDGRCAAIRASVSAALESLGLSAPETRPFGPHVPRARARNGGRGGALDVTDPPAEPWRA